VRVAKELQDISGNPNLNPMSSKVVIDILYNQFEFPKIQVRTRAAGKRIFARSSQIAVIDGWTKMHKQGTLKVSDKAWEFVEKLRHYRHVNKMRGSYIRKWKKFRGTDDRVHTSFLLRGTVTGRLSSKDPPLQTIPSKITDKWGPLVANMHIAKKGYKLVYADYSQAELMIAACLSDDEFMIKAYLSGADYHDEVSRAAFGENFTRDDRQHCKRLTYGWLYGGNVKEIALDDLQFEGSVAERFAHEWDDLFSGVLQWRTEQQKLMREKGYVETILGRRRRYTLLSKENYGKAMRVAINAPIQSAASDLTLISAIKLHEYCKWHDYATVILLIHDSVILEVREDKAQEVAELVQETMVSTAAEYFKQLPFRADAKIGTHLGELT